MQNIPNSLLEKLRQLVAHSFNDLGGQYDQLTAAEKAILTKDEFEWLLAWASHK